jgi:tetratricopeptide (TPR) repeat protein
MHLTTAFAGRPLLRYAGPLLTALMLASGARAQSAARLIAQGDSLLALEKPQRALDLYEEAMQLDPSARTHLARSRAWYMLDRMDRFLMDVEKALRMDSTLAEAQYQRALYALRAEDASRAEYHATQAVHYAKNDTLRQRSLVVRGEARADMNRAEAAIADLEAGMAAGGEEIEVLRTLARLYDSVGRHADALLVLERLCDLDPGQVGHWSNRGFELIMLERYAEALPMLEKALELDKDEPVALSNRAYIFMTMGREKEAWSDVERSLRSYPANPYALRTRAMLRLRKGEREKACEDLTLAKAIGDVPEVDRLVKEHCASLPAPRQ